jgi:FtsZ-binding cell division protein ZapB
MRDKKIVYFFSALLLFSGLLCSVDALSDTTVSFRGGGVTIDLTYPEEAHPNTTITHNVTITAHTDLSLQSFTLFIYAPVSATWQEVKNRTISWDFLENETLTSRIEFQLPQDTNGTLYCEMTVQTDQIVDNLSYKFYTTRVSELTFSEMQILYYEMLANYTSLQVDYETLLNEYDGLLANYSSLFANYTALLSEHNELIADYNSQVVTYESLLAQYNKLSDDYDDLNSNYRSKISDLGDLQAEYDELNSTSYSLQANYTSLQSEYDALNQTYTDLQTELTNLQERITRSENALNSDRIVMFIFIITVAALIAFIVYMKRKKEEPYVVIRKETVSMKKEGS